MLIGIDASRANKQYKTGTEWYSYYLIRWLAKLDSTNQYILYTDHPLTGGLLDLGTAQYIPDSGCYETVEFDNDGMQIIKSPHNNFKAKVLKWPFSFLWTQGRLSLEMLTHHPDLLFIPAHTLPIVHRRRSVVTIHDIAFEKDAQLYQSEDISSDGQAVNGFVDALVFLFSFGRYHANSTDYLRWSTKYGLKHAKQIVTVSNYTKQDIIQYYHTKEKKIAVVYNGYNSLLYKKIDDQVAINNVLADYGISGPYILYVGRIETKKNVTRLIEAFSLMKQNNKNLQHKLVLVGKASFGYDEATYAINEFGLMDDVIITGWVEENDLPYFFNGAAAFVFPSNYEGFGIPLLQAMACETPIVTSCCTSIPEVVGEAAILFNHLSVKSIAEAMEKVITDNNLRVKLIAAGKERVKMFSWQKCAEQTLDILNKVGLE